MTRRSRKGVIGLAGAGGLVGAFLLGAGPAWSIAIGQLDTFDADDELGWAAGIANPTPPNAGGGILTVTGSGQSGPGGRLTAFNRLQWAGDYITAGVTEISLDLENLGSDQLDIRLAFEESGAAPGQGGDWLATISSAPLAVGQSGSFSFGIEPADLDGPGVFATLMANAGGLRILSSESLSAQGERIDGGSLGVDNILAVPEPSTALLVVAGLGTLAWRRRR